MILRSLRWRLQVWHAGLLVVVLVGFGATACRLQWASRLREVDRDLDGAALEVLRFVRDSDPSRPRPPGPPPRRPRLGPRGETTSPEQALYFIAWTHDFTLIDRSANAPADVPLPEGIRPAAGRRPEHRTRGSCREAQLITPPGEIIVIGRSIAPEQADHGRFVLGLSLAGAGVLVAALLTGAWLAGRAIRPLAEIGASARRIASGSHSDRLDPAGLPAELADLVRVLNEGFDQIEATLQRQRQFTADASHELRTPVAVITAQTQAILARPRQEAEYRQCLEACQRAAHRMRRLVESLMTLARLDADEEPFHLGATDLNGVAREAMATIAPLVAEAGLSLEFTPAGQPAVAPVDADRLGQVLLNLLGNAVAYNRPGGTISLRVGCTPDEVFLQVTDTGIGIEPEHLPRLFDRFYRVDKSRTDSRGHAGLGLAISAEVVRRHGGRITVESEPGRGSTFTVRLPAPGSTPAAVAPA